MSSNKKLQIGVMGSMADLKYSKKVERLAEKIGYEIAQRGSILMFGAEKDFDSLSTAACRGAKRAGGLTVGITYCKGLGVYEKRNVDVVIASGLERGGGRELSLVLSCDAIICLGGGSGTLTEIAIAYQANIPIIVLKGTGGWSNKLSGQFLDERRRIKIEPAKTAAAAVTLAIRLANRTLFVGATHGNEKIGIIALEQLEKEGNIIKDEWLIGNPRAFTQSKRYIESDLNRIFPGNCNGQTYEERRAFKIMQQAQKFRNVVDIHGTDDDTGIFAIVSNSTEKNLTLARKFDVQNIVIWPSTSGRTTGPFNQFVQCGVELECGPQESTTVQAELLCIIRKYLIGGRPRRVPRYFRVYDVLEQYAGKRPLKSFRLATVAGERFYPLLVGQYPNLSGYKMKKAAMSRL